VVVEIITKFTFSQSPRLIRKELLRGKMCQCLGKDVTLKREDFRFNFDDFSQNFLQITSLTRNFRNFPQIDVLIHHTIIASLSLSLSLSFETRKRIGGSSEKRQRETEKSASRHSPVYFWMSRGRRHEPTRIACIYVMPG